MSILIDQPNINEEKPIIVEDKDKSIWQELKEFWDELRELIYIDMKNSYLFITENKNYFICTVILAFLLQFTNISNIGTSFEKYCRKGLNIKQSGGAGGVPGPPPAPFDTDLQTYRKMKDDKKADKKKAKNDASKKKIDTKRSTDEGKTEDDMEQLSKSKQSSKKAFTSEMKEQKLQAEESKANQTRISFFENIKNMGTSEIINHYKNIFYSIKYPTFCKNQEVEQ
jgi:hypothetical protein